MIEGLKVTVPGTELRALATKRAEHHESRAQQYSAQIASLPDDDDGAHAGFANSSNNKPVDAMKAKRSEHTQSGEEMRFIAAHVDAEETYLLSRDDLFRLGLVGSRY